MEPAHSCKALVLHCIDFRFRKALGEFLSSKFGDSYDLVSVAGGVKRLISDPAENNFIIEQLKISNTLHKPNTIVLIQHEDCGAYGGSKAFNTPQQEVKHQREELQKAAALLKEHFPQGKIETHFIRLPPLTRRFERHTITSMKNTCPTCGSSACPGC